MSKILKTFLALLLSGSLSAQEENKSTFQELKKLPVAPSPNASALGKFGDIPVSLSTGIPTISVPFYNYEDKTKGLNLNVSLSYHAGGHKVEDMASNTGLGWALSAGGAISRTMRGRPDDMESGYLQTGPVPLFNTTSFDYQLSQPFYSPPISEGVCAANSTFANEVSMIASGERDGESDLYNFNIGGMSGKFFFKKDGSIQLISQSNIKVSYSGFPIGQFTITDGKGVRYILADVEASQSTPSTGASAPFIPSYNSSWYITRVISADGKDTIKFAYSTITSLVYEAGFSRSFTSSYVASPGGNVLAYTDVNESYNVQEIIAAKRVSSIDMPDGTQLLFYYNHARLDFVGDNALTAVHIKNQGLEKRFLLNYGYFESDNCGPSQSGCTQGIAYSAHDYYKRLKLLSVQESDGVKTLPPYIFEYNPTKLPVRNSKRQDWWGYYNGAGDEVYEPVTAPSSAPPNFLTADRPPSLSRTKAWVLEKMFYPTGGNTRFVYELNEGYHDASYRAVGGLRVARSEDFDPVTEKTLITNYSYKKTDNTSSGRIHTVPAITCYWTTYYVNPPGGNPYRTYKKNELERPTQSLSFLNGSPVIYTRVRVAKEGGGTENGFSVYEYSASSGSYVHDNVFPYIQMQDIDWGQGQLIKESHFKNLTTPVRTVENEYNYFYTTPGPSDNLSRNLMAGLLFWDANGTPNYNMVGARSYYMTFGRAELKKTTERIYGQGGTFVENVTEHTYDNQYYVPTVTKTYDGKGDKEEQKMYYAFNCNVAGFPNKAAMLAANRVAEVVAQEGWVEKAGTAYLRNASVNEYALYGTVLRQSKAVGFETEKPLGSGVVGIFNPDNLRRHTGFKDQVTFTDYDTRGRYSEVEYSGQEKYSFFWGKDNNYPRCTVKGAVSADFAYASFEGDGNIGWSNISVPDILSAKGVTGVRHYQKTGFSVSKAGLTSGTQYLVTYWSKGGAYAVTGTQAGWPKTGLTISIAGQLWTAYEHLVTGLTTVTVSGSGALDELRLYPRQAEMTTLASNPLTGVTEQVDVANNITFYEYDNFLRLSVVRDRERNVVKKICYNYPNRADDCSGNTTLALWQVTGQVRCKPCPANSAYLSGQQEQEEQDMNTASPTYNTKRWVLNGTSSQCMTLAAWQTISSSCEVSGGQNTGRQLQIQKDMNTCSPTYNTTRTISVINHVTCPPPGCNLVNCTGVDKKCVGGNCETGVKIYTASTFNQATGNYDCTYHYEWGDGTWSPDYVEVSYQECFLG